MSTVGILILGRRRPGFDPDWGSHVVSCLDTALANAPFACFRPGVRIVDDASLRDALAECRKADAEAVVVLQPTMSDGNLAATLAHVWDGPLVLWATPEKPEGAMISSCSLVGAHTFAATLRQLRTPFELVYGMPGDAAVTGALTEALRLACAVPRLRRAKIGLVGAHAPGFIDMQADPFVMRRQLGPQLRHFGLQEFMDAARAAADDAVLADVRAVEALGLPLVDVGADELPLASRFHLAMEALAADESLDALAIRCWPELPNVMGQWPYLAFARLATAGFSVACEGDADGALSCLVADLLGCGQCTLSDWLEHDRETITLWHAGSAPFGLCEPVGSPGGPRIARHFNNRKAAVVDANLRTGMPITLFRLWRCDDLYHLTTAEGTTIAPRRPLLGTNGLAEIPGVDVCEYFDQLCHAGMPHHVAVVEGHHARLFRRFAERSGIRVV
mgnify:CR=1 FL=1